jgi:hypothetical protein
MADALPEADAEIRHISDPKRLEEAATVVPVACAFAEAEIAARGDELGIGIYGRANLVPPLYQQLGKKLRKATPDELEAARYAVYTALAAGYLGFMSVEADSGISYRPADAAHVWSVTVHNFRGEGLASVRIPPTLVAQIEQHGRMAW